MKKYYWALFIFFIFIYVVPRVFVPFDAAHQDYAMKSYEIYQSGAYNLQTLDSYITGGIINLFGSNNFSLAFSDILSVACLSLFMIFAIKKCTNDMVLALFSCLLFISSFWIFSLYNEGSVITENFSGWGALINFLGLGSYFMASREGRFSFQRIGLLALCGVLTFASLRINGLNPFFLSLFVATFYMLAQKRYLDMILMPLIIAFVAILLLVLQSIYLYDNGFKLIDYYLNNMQTYYSQIATNATNLKETLITNLIALLLGLAPILVFVCCSLIDFKKNYIEFIKRPIYKFSFIFLLIGIIFTMLTDNVTLEFGMLPITYIPFSFLVATGLVYYLRTHNSHNFLDIMLMSSGIVAISIGVLLLDFKVINSQYNILAYGLMLAGFSIVSTCKMNLNKKIAVYFISFILVIISLIPRF